MLSVSLVESLGSVLRLVIPFRRYQESRRTQALHLDLNRDPSFPRRVSLSGRTSRAGDGTSDTSTDNTGGGRSGTGTGDSHAGGGINAWLLRGVV